MSREIVRSSCVRKDTANACPLRLPLCPRLRRRDNTSSCPLRRSASALRSAYINLMTVDIQHARDTVTVSSDTILSLFRSGSIERCFSLLPLLSACAVFAFAICLCAFHDFPFRETSRIKALTVEPCCFHHFEASGCINETDFGVCFSHTLFAQD